MPVKWTFTSRIFPVGLGLMFGRCSAAHGVELRFRDALVTIADRVNAKSPNSYTRTRTSAVTRGPYGHPMLGRVPNRSRVANDEETLLALNYGNPLRVRKRCDSSAATIEVTPLGWL